MNRKKKRCDMRLPCTLALVAVCSSFAVSAHADSNTITFNSLQHGEVINTQFVASHGVTVRARNVGGGPNLAVAFDSERVNTRDSDLQGPPWSAGNLAGNVQADLGRLVIIQENSCDRNNDGFMDYPDDEGSRPAGWLKFDFDTPTSCFGFDLVDIDGCWEYGCGRGYVAFYLDGVELDRVGWGEFVNSSSPFYDPTIRYGDNSANRIQPITAAQLDGVTHFDRVKINMGGSGGVDNIRWCTDGGEPEPDDVIPEPLTFVGVLLSVGAIGAKMRQRLATVRIGIKE